MTKSLRLAPALAAALGILSACGGSSGGSSSTGTNPGPAPAAQSRLHLASEPIDGFGALALDLQKVEIHGPQGWTTLATPARTLDVLALQDTDAEALATGFSLPAGHYDALRVSLGGGSTVKLGDGSTAALSLPAAYASGVTVPISLELASGATPDLWIDLDASRSVQTHADGPTPYTLYPVFRLVDGAGTGSISGKLLHEGELHPIPGTWVYAETFDAQGQPHVARTVRTDAEGRYKLDLLPLGQAYHVVSWAQEDDGHPHLGTSDAQAVDAAHRAVAYDGYFKAMTYGGALVVNVAPVAAAGQTDLIFQVLPQATPTQGTKPFIIRFHPGDLMDTQERYLFNYTPAGTYTAVAERCQRVADGTMTVTTKSYPNAEVGTSGSNYVLVKYE